MSDVDIAITGLETELAAIIADTTGLDAAAKDIFDALTIPALDLTNFADTHIAVAMAIMQALSIEGISDATKNLLHHFWERLWYWFWKIVEKIYYFLKKICNPPIYHKSYPHPYYSEAQLESAEGQPETLSQCMAASHEFMQLAEKGYYGSAYGKYPPDKHMYKKPQWCVHMLPDHWSKYTIKMPSPINLPGDKRY